MAALARHLEKDKKGKKWRRPGRDSHKRLLPSAQEARPWEGVTSTGPIAGELGVSGEGKEKQINEVLVWEAVSNVIFLKIKRSGWGRCARAWAPGLTWIMELVTLTEQCVGQS